MKHHLLQLIVIMVTWTFGTNAQIVVNVKRYKDHFPLQPIKLSIIPPSNFMYSGEEMIFSKNGESTITSKYQVSASKFFLPYNQIKDSLTSGVAQSQVNLYRINNYDGVLINQNLINGSESANTYVFAFGNQIYTYIISGFCPTNDHQSIKQIKESILTSYVDTFGYSKYKGLESKGLKTANFTQATSPAFGIDISSSDFKIAEEIGDLIRYYTKDGAFPSFDIDRSYIKIIKTSAIVSNDNYEEFSKSLIGTYNEFDSIVNVTGNRKSSTTDSLDGFELYFDAKINDGVPVQVYQLCLFDSNAVFILLGVKFGDQTGTNIELLKALFHTFKRS